MFWQRLLIAVELATLACMCALEWSESTHLFVVLHLQHQTNKKKQKKKDNMQTWSNAICSVQPRSR
jgi:hypothetical protein